MFLVGFSGRADPDMTIYENFHSKGGFNRATFNTEWVPDDDQEDLDAKIEKARAIYDQDERKAMYDDIQSQIVLNAHGIFFTHQKSIIGTSKRVQDPGAFAMHVILPAATLGLHMTGSLTRQTRSSMLDVLSQDYVRTARAKGLLERRIVIQHAMRNALLPVLTVLGVQAGTLIGGTVVIEQVFAIPGMGRLAVDSVFAQDIPVLQGVVLVAAAAVLIATLVTDILYGVLDPRIQYG